jgi:hypothetical protein
MFFANAQMLLPFLLFSWSAFYAFKLRDEFCKEK